MTNTSAQIDNSLEFKTSRMEFFAPAEITALAFNSNGDLAAGCNDGSVLFMEQANSKKNPETIHTENSIILALAGDRTSFHVGGDAGVVETLNSKGVYSVHKLDGSWIEFIKHNPGNDITFSVSARSANIKSGNAEASITKLDGAPTGAAISGNGELCAITNKNGYSVWNNEGEKISSFKTRGAIRGLAWSPDNRYMCGAFQEGDIFCWQAADESEVLLAALELPFTHYTWSSNSKWLAGAAKSELNLWKVTRAGLESNPFRLIPCASDITAIAWNPKIQAVCAGTKDGRIWIISMERDEIRYIDGENAITNLAWNANGETLAAAHSSGLVKIHRPI